MFHKRNEKTVLSFYDIVAPIVDGKTVLDIGSIGHSYMGREGYKQWNFAMISQHAASVLGIDILPAEIELARADGHDIELGDAETYLATKAVDVVFAGDLVEHLSNPGRFLSCSFENLVDDGLLVLCTPNTYSFAKMVRVLIYRTNEPPVNPEHTCYYTPKTLAHLASRHGFRLSAVSYCDLAYTPGHGTLGKRVQLAVNRLLSWIAPRFSQTMVVTFEKIPTGKHEPETALEESGLTSTSLRTDR